MIYKEDYEEHDHEFPEHECFNAKEFGKLEKRIEKLERKVSQLIDVLYKKAMIKFEIEGD